MNRNTLIIGAFIAGAILLLTPSAPAVEYNSAKETYRTRFYERYATMTIDELKRQIQNSDTRNTQEILTSFDFSKLKQLLQNKQFIDIALLLTVVNIFIIRILTKIQGGSATTLLSISSLLFFLSYSLFILLIEYKTDVMFPRYKMYQAYFFTLFSIILMILGFNFTPGKHSLVVSQITVLLYLFAYFFSKYLGNLLYVALGRPS